MTTVASVGSERSTDVGNETTKSNSLKGRKATPTSMQVVTRSGRRTRLEKRNAGADLV